MPTSPSSDIATALVLDRDRLFGEVVTPLLEDLEFQVSVATIAETAQELISRKRPKLAVVDLSLPADHGFAVGQHALATHSDAIVIGTTTLADPRIVRESKRAGFWGCLSKDVPLSRFTSHVRAAMRGAPALSSRECLEPAGPSRRSRPLDLLSAQLTARELEVLGPARGGRRKQPDRPRAGHQLEHRPDPRAVDPDEAAGSFPSGSGGRRGAPGSRPGPDAARVRGRLKRRPMRGPYAVYVTRSVPPCGTPPIVVTPRGRG